MNAEFTGTTQKQSRFPPSGAHHHLLDRRKCGRWSPISRPCWLRSSTLTGWFIEFVPTGQTVNKEFYKTVLQRLRDAARRHRPEKWRSSNWILHHNAAAHRVVTTNEFLAKYNIPSLPQPPHSPDLAPCDFFLFPRLKKRMKGRRFDYVEDIQANAMRQLRAIKKSDYQRCFRQWQERWNKCIQAQGHYFEGYKTN